jgi:hypothetical protein
MFKIFNFMFAKNAHCYTNKFVPITTTCEGSLGQIYRLFAQPILKHFRICLSKTVVLNVETTVGPPKINLKILAAHYKPLGSLLHLYLSLNELFWLLLDVFFADKSCNIDSKQNKKNLATHQKESVAH